MRKAPLLHRKQAVSTQLGFDMPEICQTSAMIQNAMLVVLRNYHSRSLKPPKVVKAEASPCLMLELGALSSCLAPNVLDH